MKYKNLILIGTSHIAEQSLREVEESIEKENPDIIAVELDKRRKYALLSNQNRKISVFDIKHVGFKGYLFSLIGAFLQKKLGKIVGISPGSEMLTAIKLANEKKIKVALIDQDILVTLQRLKSISFIELLKLFIIDPLKGLIFKKSVVDGLEIRELDLRKVPEKDLIRKLMKVIRKRYPILYRVLIEERNEYMALKLAKIMYTNEDKKILAVVGAGHEEELIDLIKKKIDVVSYSYNYSYK